MTANVDESDNVTPAEVRVALARILASPRFQACPRLTSFLQFVVEATLAGGASRLKGYTIGIEALGRNDSFDPQIDPIVRVEATRLRRALDRYYAAEGAGERIAIELPRGRYVPIFRRVRAPVLFALWTWARAKLHRFLAAEGLRLLPSPAIATQAHPIDVRQNQQAEGAPAARTRRPRAG